MTAPKQMREGIGLDKATADKLDKKRIASTQKEEPADVSGQYDAWVRCPSCGAACYVRGLNTNYYVPRQCWNCGYVFLA